MGESQLSTSRSSLANPEDPKLWLRDTKISDDLHNNYFIQVCLNVECVMIFIHCTCFIIFHIEVQKTICDNFGKYVMSRVMRKSYYCLCENKCADQLCSNCTAGQRLCIRNTEKTFLLYSYPKFKDSSFHL